MKSVTQMFAYAVGIVLIFSQGGCSSGSSGSSVEEVFVDFSRGSQGWIAGFSDYPVGQEGFFKLEADHRPLPDPFDSMGSALFISGNNHSDDLFMYYKVKVPGFEPDRTYRVRFTVEFATNVPQGCTGIGGSPGESVYVKAGASGVEPLSVNRGGTYRMNVDKGNQSSAGSAAVVLGDVAGSQRCGAGTPEWELKEISGRGTVDVTADLEGSLWFFFGTDSGFEGTTSLYYTHFMAVLE